VSFLAERFWAKDSQEELKEERKNQDDLVKVSRNSLFPILFTVDLIEDYFSVLQRLVRNGTMPRPHVEKEKDAVRSNQESEAKKQFQCLS
jgi:hypothetical protein